MTSVYETIEWIATRIPDLLCNRQGKRHWASPSPSHRPTVKPFFGTTNYRYDGRVRRKIVYVIRPKGERGATKVGKIVLEAFGYMQPSYKHQVNRINGNPKDNRIKHLRWVTHSKNIRNQGKRRAIAELPNEIKLTYYRMLKKRWRRELFLVIFSLMSYIVKACLHSWLTFL